MKLFTKADFLMMPWKNGGGVTRELYLIPQGDSFGFRLSIATVNADGPFSIFPNIERILLLLQGKGFHLKTLNHTTVLIDETPYYFAGEEAIDCTLIDGGCLDFNVMTNRSFAKSTISLTKLKKDETSIFTTRCDLTFLYDKENENLYELSPGENVTIKTQKPTTIFVIDVTLYDQK